MGETWEGLLILGLGNPLLSDDAVGREAAEALGPRFPGAVVRTMAMIGMDLLDAVLGFEGLCLLDAMCTGEVPPGSVACCLLPEKAVHLGSSHGPDLHNLLSLGRLVGLPVPGFIGVYGIEIGQAIPYGETLTPALREALGSAVEEIASALRADMDAWKRTRPGPKGPWARTITTTRAKEKGNDGRPCQCPPGTTKYSDLRG